MKLDVPAIGILRGVEADFFERIMHASFDAGLSAIELTINTQNAENIIQKCRGSVPPDKLLGMGTIRNLNEAKRAADAGAMFFVTPNVDLDVIAYAVKKDIPVIAGALTPTEIYNAWSEGATMIKVFPCGAFGPQYFKDLAGPFEDIPLVAVGGVNTDNLKDYFNAGAKAVGVSSSLFGKEAFNQQKIDQIAENVNKFVSLCRGYNDFA